MLFYILALVFGIGFIFDPVFAYDLPINNSTDQYFCIFGLRGSRFDGTDKADPGQVIYFDVPENQTSELIIDVFDPDTGGKLDQKDFGNENWETIFQFAVYGKEDGLLAKKRFSESLDYDRAYYRFGPYPKEMGKKINGFYRFELVASPVKTLILKSDDLNLFRVRVYPEDVEASSKKISLRLASNKNDEMCFYPEIPARESEIIVENYDLDPDGGEVRLYDPLTQKNYPIYNSGSGVWAQTTVQISASDEPRRLEYIITKKTQQYGNASIRVKDRQGHVLPIYYSQISPKALPVTAAVSIPVKAKAVKIASVSTRKKELKAAFPVIAQPMKTISSQCNKFTFDGTGSYDPDNDKLSFFWDFGDSTTSTEPVVTHVFEKGGQYKVILTVKDSSGLTCDTARTTQAVSVNMPPVAVAGADKFACLGQEVLFDGTGSSDADKDELTYTWDFGDGTTAKGAQVRHSFEKPGKYRIVLLVDDGRQTLCSIATSGLNVFVNTPPVAVGQADFVCCIDTESVFDGTASSDADGDSLTYQWEFGDGGSAQGVKATHQYNKGGIYTVILKVDDNSQTACSNSQTSFKVRINEKPVSVIKIK